MKLNAESLGFPNLNTSKYNLKLIDSGAISSMVIKGLSAKGGNGTMTLVTKSNKKYTTGTIKLTSRETGGVDEAIRIRDALVRDSFIRRPPDL
jgi:hypothetical protein